MVWETVGKIQQVRPSLGDMKMDTWSGRDGGNMVRNIVCVCVCSYFAGVCMLLDLLDADC